MRGLRTIPVLLDVCRDMEELLPRRAPAAVRQPDGDALLGGGRAPAASAPSACATASSTPPASSPPTSGSRPSEIDYHVAGINHMAFFLRFERDGEDLYPALRERRPPPGRQPGALRDAAPPRLLRHRVQRALRRVRAVVHQGGAARPDRALQHPARRVPAPLRGADRRVGGAARAAARAAARSTSRAASSTARDIIRACETGEPFAFNGNVPNALDGGPPDRQPARPTAASRCRASPRRAGSSRSAVGALPRHLAALMQTNVNVQGLTVEAALTGRPRAVYHAAMLDPHTAGELRSTRSPSSSTRCSRPTAT